MGFPEAMPPFPDGGREAAMEGSAHSSAYIRTHCNFKWVKTSQILSEAGPSHLV